MLKKNISADGYAILNNTLNVVKLHPDAEEPFKENPRDVGWELTIIGREENRVEDVFTDVNVFTTGVQVTAPKNYHLEIVEHPQLFKAGYALAGGPRIINPSDTSEILVPLYKFKEVEDLELPFRAAVLVLRQTEYIPTAVVAKSSSRRGATATTKSRMEEEAAEDEYVAEAEPSRRTTKSKGRGQAKSNHMF